MKGHSSHTHENVAQHTMGELGPHALGTKQSYTHKHRSCCGDSGAHVRCACALRMCACAHVRVHAIVVDLPDIEALALGTAHDCGCMLARNHILRTRRYMGEILTWNGAHVHTCGSDSPSPLVKNLVVITIDSESLRHPLCY